MPNWCSNNLTISHRDPAQVQRLAEAFNDDKLFQTIIPVPLELQNDETTSYGGDDAVAKDQLREQLLAKYGYQSWYDFCINEWGTKWEANSYDKCEHQAGDTTVYMSFDTAWAPPLGIYQALTAQGFEVEAMYYEPGCGFAGIWCDGVDDYYELNGLTSVAMAANLPRELDDAFGISENAQQWEEEEDTEELREWVEDGAEKLNLDQENPQ